MPSRKKRLIFHLYKRGHFGEADVLIKVFYNGALDLRRRPTADYSESSEDGPCAVLCKRVQRLLAAFGQERPVSICLGVVPGAAP